MYSVNNLNRADNTVPHKFWARHITFWFWMFNKTRMKDKKKKNTLDKHTTYKKKKEDKETKVGN